MYICCPVTEPRWMLCESLSLATLHRIKAFQKWEAFLFSYFSPMRTVQTIVAIILIGLSGALGYYVLQSEREARRSAQLQSDADHLREKINKFIQVAQILEAREEVADSIIRSQYAKNKDERINLINAATLRDLREVISELEPDTLRRID